MLLNTIYNQSLKLISSLLDLSIKNNKIILINLLNIFHKIANTFINKLKEKICTI